MNRLENRTEGSAAKFHLDTGNGKFLGVCSGLGGYFGVDPLLVRTAFVLGTLVGFGSFILIYFLIALLAD